MPYASVEELPEPVGEHLPLHAQEIYRAPFDNAPGPVCRSRR